MHTLTVSIHEAHFWGFVGMYEEEQKIRNEILISIQVSKNMPPDQIEFIDYTTLFDIAQSVMQTPSKLLEDIIQKIRLLINDKIAYDTLEIEVKKKNPPTGTKVEYSSVKWLENKFL